MLIKKRSEKQNLEGYQKKKEEKKVNIKKGKACFTTATMVLQRLGICVELVKLAIEFVVVVADAVGIVIQQNDDRQVARTAVSQSFVDPVPFVGFLP